MSLAGAAVHRLIHLLPSGTAFCIGGVLMAMMTGRLVPHKGSLARAVLPVVVHLRWGWHQLERAMERGKMSLDALCDHDTAGEVNCADGDPMRCEAPHALRTIIR